MQDAIITFEQPLNEYIRVCLRLEHLFAQVLDNISDSPTFAAPNVASAPKKTSTTQPLINTSVFTEAKPAEPPPEPNDPFWQCRTAMKGLLEALTVLDRPDLKSKITQALVQHIGVLTQLQEKPNVDHDKLRDILAELEQITESLYKTQDKIGQSLRNNIFLNTIRQHMANPGGACPFSTPAYYLWLQQPAALRNQQIKSWFQEFDLLRVAVRLLLQLVRHSAQPQSLTASGGFYQQALDPKLSFHLVRVSVKLKYQVYPEISVGKHRMTVRFLELNTHDRAAQSGQDIPFELTCCLGMLNK